MDSNSSFQDSSYVVSKFQNPQVSRQKKVKAFQVNFSEFNNKLVAAFYNDGVENSVSFHCLTFFLLWMLKKYFYYISSVLSGVLMFRTYQ